MKRHKWTVGIETGIGDSIKFVPVPTNLRRGYHSYHIYKCTNCGELVGSISGVPYGFKPNCAEIQMRRALG